MLSSLPAPAQRAGEDAAAPLLAIVEETAPAVAAHMQRTARLARLLALELDVAEPLLELVVGTARLHDVGKLSIPPWVLGKRGPLRSAERALVRDLPAIGQLILERRPALQELGVLVRATHERWDGLGYPDGLAGCAIPLPARIVAVCDAFDAMTTARPHRSSLPLDAALEELRAHAGMQFDPGAVAAFRALLAIHVR
jgi:HD-GYP domain-containing protein (c-di-GMP phosphodiesterase class II)